MHTQTLQRQEFSVRWKIPDMCRTAVAAISIKCQSSYHVTILVN
jgi:hypothetical protein